MLSLNNLQNAPGSKHNSKRLGRGIGSGKGKTAGKGHKGQKARKGVSIRWFEGGQTSLIKRLPKRGFNPIKRDNFSLINFTDINRMLELGQIDNNQKVDTELLVHIGFIKSLKEKVKLLAKGDLISKNIKFDLDSYSKSAKEKVEFLGGECL